MRLLVDVLDFFLARDNSEAWIQLGLIHKFPFFGFQEAMYVQRALPSRVSVYGGVLLAFEPVLLPSDMSRDDDGRRATGLSAYCSSSSESCIHSGSDLDEQKSSTSIAPCEDRCVRTKNNVKRNADEDLIRACQFSFLYNRQCDECALTNQEATRGNLLEPVRRSLVERVPASCVEQWSDKDT